LDILVTEDQEFFREATGKFLEQECPLPQVRALYDDPAGFTPAYWKQGAELGWTSLLVPEELGGGTVSGSAVLDFMCLIDLFGTHVAPGPLLATNLVAAAIARTGSAQQQTDVLPGLLAGDTVAAWADAGSVAVERDGDDLVLRGVHTPVEAGGQAQVLLVTATLASSHDALGAPVQVLVDPKAAGVTVTALRSIDMTRRFAKVSFDGARVPVSALVGGTDAGNEIAWLRLLAATAQSVEATAAAQVAFDLTMEWMFDRYTFGRPLASYQALKHRCADMKLWLEASHGLVTLASRALQTDAPDASEWVSGAKAYTGQFLAELVQDCIQLHGGIGLTWEHDLHLYQRRIVADRNTHGTPDEHRQRLADIREGA
jgi:alkylation response protein AidB-like acyl-CoA dehydrogenase